MKSGDRFCCTRQLCQGKRQSAAGGGGSEPVSRRSPDWRLRQQTRIAWHDGGNRQSLRVHCCGCGAYGTMRASLPTEIYNSPCRGGQGRPPLRMTWWRAEVDDRKGRPLRIAGTSSGRSRALPVAFFIFLRKRRYGGVGAGILCIQEKLCNFSADFLFT